MEKIIVLCIVLLGVPAFGQMITNEDLEKKYGQTNASADDDKDTQAEDIKKRREENSKARESLNCQQLKTAGKTNTAEYRRSCLSPEERQAIEDRTQKKKEAREKAYRDYKDNERDRKLDEMHRKMTFGF